MGTKMDIFSVFSRVSSSLYLHLCLTLRKTWAGTEPFVTHDRVSDSLLPSSCTYRSRSHSLWNEIFFLKGGFGHLTEQHDDHKTISYHITYFLAVKPTKCFQNDDTNTSSTPFLPKPQPFCNYRYQWLPMEDSRSAVFMWTNICLSPCSQKVR